VEFRDKLDLDPHHGQRLRRELGREGGQRGQRGPGAGRPADGGGRPRRPVDQPLRDFVVGLARELRAERGLVTDPQPRSHRDYLRGQPAHAPRHATADRTGPPAGTVRPLASGRRTPARRDVGATASRRRRVGDRGRGPVGDALQPRGDPPPVRRTAGFRQFDGDLGSLPSGGVVGHVPAVYTGHLGHPPVPAID
jgi:hypothetical protein